VAVPGSEVRVNRGESYPELTPESLFDRIINLKFIRWDRSSFVVRSDYEPVFQKDGSIQFIPCRMKPHIKVSYKQVSQDTAVTVDIEVANLFIDKSQGDHLIAAGSEAADTADPGRGNPVTNIVVQLGYRGQFPDWTEPTVNRDPALYYDLYNSYIARGGEAKSGMQLYVTVLDTYTDGTPPDQMTRFHGIIGTAETGLLWSHTEEDLVRTADDFDQAKNGAPFLWHEIQRWITRRYIRSDIPHRVNTVTDKEGGVVEQHVYIYGLKDYREKLKPPDIPPWKLDELAKAVNQPKEIAPWKIDKMAASLTDRPPDTEWGELALVDGVLSDEDAALFGLPCLLSARLLREPAPEKAAYGAVDEDGSRIIPAQFILSDYPQNSLSAQLAVLCATYEYLRYYVMADGSLYFYHVDEQKEDLFMNTRLQALAAANNGGPSRALILPAIYDIEYGGSRTIRCPFFYLISPMTVVFFSARYYIGSMVGFYYYPDQKDAKYLVLQAAVEFSTDGDENMMTLMCVDYKREDPPFLVDGTVQWGTTEADKQALAFFSEQTKRYAWKALELTVSGHARASDEPIALQSTGRWLDIVYNRLLLPLGYPVGSLWSALWADYRDKPVDWVYKRALEDLAAWNPAYFTDDRLREPNPENREWARLTHDAEGGPVESVPLLKPGEKVIYRYPWKPEYGGEGRL
jgi:hypothetical protein